MEGRKAERRLQTGQQGNARCEEARQSKGRDRKGKRKCKRGVGLARQGPEGSSKQVKDEAWACKRMQSTGGLAGQGKEAFGIAKARQVTVTFKDC